MTRNMTGETMEKIMDLFPDSMEAGELSAVTLTIIETYLTDNLREAINVLMTSTVIYALRSGISKEDISKLFLAASEDVLNNNSKERMN